MARQDGAGTRRRSPAAALEAGREHLGGDKPQGAAAETAENQGAAGAGAVEKGGEEGRAPFTLTEEQRGQLAEARRLDGESQTTDHETAFWAQLGEAGGFNQVTVQPADDILESGSFTAWPRETAETLDTANNEAGHMAGLDRMEEIADAAEMALDSLGGDLRDCMLDIFRNRHKPWSALSPIEQRDVASAINFAVEVSLRKATRLIAADGRAAITATLEKYADKGGEITATIKIAGADDSTILALHRASGKQVMIVSADVGAYMGQRADVRIDREDPELAFDAGNDHPADDRDLAGDEDDEEQEEADAEAQYAAAVAAVRDGGNASPAFLQRTLQLPYSAASAAIERMEREGIVSAPDDVGHRNVVAVDSGDHGDSEPAAASEAAETA